MGHFFMEKESFSLTGQINWRVSLKISPTLFDSSSSSWLSACRFSPMVFLYLSTVIPSIWFLELSLLQIKLPVNISSGPELHLLAHIPIASVRVVP